MITVTEKPLVELTQATIGFCGDSGDGMQLVGTEFASASANLGNDISTFPDFPAEIRAPVGTLAGVSGFQVQFSSTDIYTPGDRLNALVAMNPAALKTRLRDVEPGGILIVNKDAFAASDLRKANCASNPLEDGSLAGYRLISIPLTSLNREAVAGAKLSPREADRCKNFFALGLVYWLYERPLEPTLRWIRDKFGKKEAVLLANSAALKAGYNYGETVEALPVHYHVGKAVLPPGRYRKITGNEALAIGLAAAAVQAETPMLYAGYPITPASDILHHLVGMKHFPVSCIQAEDEIAAAGMAIGAAFGGRLGVTATSGPGICLKSEAIGLAVMTELPLVVIDVQRGGPSTGLPTKTEQADLLQAMYGRNGECPAAIVAPCSPGDCFTMALEAVRLAVGHMTPVFILSDGYLANGAEPWLVPDPESLPKIPVRHPTTPNVGSNGDSKFMPYLRDERLVRPWAIPGTPGLEHRHRRHREGADDRQRQLRPAEPRGDGAMSGAKDRQHCRRHSAFGGRWSGGGRSAGDRLGRNLRLDHDGRGTRPPPRPERGPGPPALPQPDAAQHRTGVEALQEGARSGTELRPAGPAVAGGVPGGRRQPEQGAGAAVPGQRDRGEDRRNGGLKSEPGA